MVDIHANLLSVMNDNDFLVILPDDIKFPLYACGASGLWDEKVRPKLPGYLEISRYYFRYWTKERLFPDPEYSVMIFRGTVEPVPNSSKSSERAVWLVNDTVVKLLEDRYGTINTLFHDENIYDLRDADSGSMYYYVGGRHNGKTEALKKMLNNMYGTSKLTMPIPKVGDVELTFDKVEHMKREPFPPYKYDWGAYQKIAASREAMKRAENGDHFADALSYYVGKGLKELEREYILNDAKATKEMVKNFMKEEENENMKQNNKTTVNAKTLTGYLTDFSINHMTPYDDNSIEIVLKVPEMGGCASCLTDADIRKAIYDHDLMTLTFEKATPFAVPRMRGALKPKKVIFNNPATIVLWNDGTKTVVTRQKGDRYNKEEGLALCYMKKALGNSSRVFNDALHAGLEMGEK